MSKLLGIIGIGIVAGTFIYVLLNKKESIQKNSGVRSKDTPETFSADNAVSIITPNDTHGDNTKYEETKASTVETIYTRHKEASNVMREAIDIIYSRAEISKDENHDLDQLSDELDKLLGEE